MTEPKCERVVQELIRRLNDGFPRTLIERGWFGDRVKITPSMYLIEMEEQSAKDRVKQKGMYKRALPILICYFLKGGDTPSSTYRRANMALRELSEKVELDELFQGLVTDYGVTTIHRMLHLKNIVQLAVIYTFQYTEFAPWAGNNRRRM